MVCNKLADTLNILHVLHVDALWLVSESDAVSI